MNNYYMQDEAEKLSDIFPECERLSIIANNCCCASVALWIMGIDEKHHLEIIAEELGKGLGQEDCLVYWKNFFRNVSGREINVEFRTIKALSDLNDVKGKCAVLYKQGSFKHWVGVENKTVNYNSIKKSNCVEAGKPVEARIITFV